MTEHFGRQAIDVVARVADTLRLIGAFAYRETESSVEAYGLPEMHRPVLIIPAGSIVDPPTTKGAKPVLAELLKIHSDFGAGAGPYQVICLRDAHVVVSGASQAKPPITREARRYLPRIAEIAAAANSMAEYSFNDRANTGVKITFSGGWIEPATRTTAKGHGRDFRFELNEKPYGETHHMTDILAYRQFGAMTLNVRFVNNKTLSVKPPSDGGILWIANLSTDPKMDKNPNRSTHSAMYFDFLIDRGHKKPQNRPIAVAPNKDVEKSTTTPLQLPCLAPSSAGTDPEENGTFANPPDSEFCVDVLL